MTDLPDDLTAVGRHRGNDAPTETGKEVRCPEGPPPDATPATPATALFQVVRRPDPDRIQIRIHSARAQISAPEHEETEEIGQYRSVDDLRAGLADVSIEGRTAVFEDAEADTVLTDTDVSPDHAWIGQPRYERITFVEDEGAASDYVSTLDRPLA